MPRLGGVFDIVNRVDIVGHKNGGTCHHADVIVVIVEVIRITKNSLVAFQLVSKRGRHAYHPITFFHINNNVFRTRGKQQCHEANYQHFNNFLHGVQYLKLYEMEGTAENRYMFLVIMEPSSAWSKVMAHVL